MADGALDVLVRFVADSKQVTQETAKVTGTGSKVKTWAKGIGGAIAGAFAVDKIRDFVNAGAELQDQISAGQQIFGSAAKSVEQWAGRSATAFGISKTDALSAANTFATFGKAAGKTGGDLGAFSTKLVGLAGDLASFRGTSTEQAIDAIGAALRGESEPIRAYGVLLDAASLKAQALSMGLVKGTGDARKIATAQLGAQKALVAYNEAIKKHGKDSTQAHFAQQQFAIAQGRVADATKGTVPELTAQQKVLASQALIFKQTKDAQGDFARTGDSAANQQKKLKAEMQNVSAALGTALLPAVQQILPYIQDLATFVEKNASWLVPLAAAVTAVALAFKIWTAIQTLFNIQLGISMGWILLIIVAIVAVVAAIIWLIKNFDTVKAVGLAVWNAIKLAAIATWNAIKTAASAVWQAILAGWNWIKGAALATWGAITGAARATWNAITGAASAVLGWFRTHWPTLLAILTGPIGIAVLVIARNWDSIKGFAKSVFEWFKSTWSTLADIVSAPFRAAFRAISSFWNATIGGFGFKTPGWLGPLGNKEFRIPEMPSLDTGGFITRTGVAMVHRGETVVPAGAGGNVFNITVNAPPLANPAAVGRVVVDSIRAYENVAGTSWRRSPTGRNG